ncbi:Uncharacterised protein g5499 [Pycnogonum litorale]
MNRYLAAAVTSMLMVAYAVTAEVHSPQRQPRFLFFNGLNGTNNLATSFGSILMVLPALILPIILLVGLGAVASALFSKVFEDDEYRRRSFQNATGLNLDNILEKLDNLPDIVNTIAKVIRQ